MKINILKKNKSYTCMALVAAALLACGCSGTTRDAESIREDQQMDEAPSHAKTDDASDKEANQSAENKENDAVTAENSADTEAANTDESGVENTSASLDESSEGKDSVSAAMPLLEEKFEIDADFENAIADIKDKNILPDGTKFEIAGAPVIEYAVADINRDGLADLIVSVTAQSSKDSFEAIYIKDANGKITRLFKEYVGMIFYETGNIKTPWSANPGLNSSIWPYSIYEYDKEKTMYNYAGFVDSWDYSENPTDYEKNDFPKEYDKDNDGILYSMRYYEEYEYGYIHDGSEVEDLLNRVLGRELKVEFTKL